MLSIRALIFAAMIYTLSAGILSFSSELWASVTTSFSKTADLQIQNFEVALISMYQDIGRYPSTSEGLASLLNQVDSVHEKLWDGPYMHKIPLDPWGAEYQYRLKPKLNKPFIYSTGKNRMSESDGNDLDDINNWDPKKKWQNYYQRGRYNDIFRCVIVLVVLLATIYYLQMPKQKNK